MAGYGLALSQFGKRRKKPLSGTEVHPGGAGTVQTAIYSATPLVGVPMHLEQAENISLVTHQSAGIMLSKQELTRRKLGGALERLVSDASFRRNMLRLKELQDRGDGAAHAASEIVDFLDCRD